MKDPVTKRPSRYDDGVNRAVAEALLPRVVRWLEPAGGMLSEEEHREILEQLTAACNFNDDGYEVVKALDDRFMWDVDSELVGVLDAVPFERIGAHKKVVEAWVEQHGPAPKYSVGQRVAFRWPRCDKKVVGEVTRLEARTAQYVVFCEEIGHVRSGTGTTGVYLNYEDVEPA